LGPIELWAFSTTAEDVAVRDQLYRYIGPSETRRFLAAMFPSGSILKELNERLNRLRTEEGLIEEQRISSALEALIKDILDCYAQNPNAKNLSVKI
jgi:intracellular multiplication protein IcmB